MNGVTSEVQRVIEMVTADPTTLDKNLALRIAKALGRGRGDKGFTEDEVMVAYRDMLGAGVHALMWGMALNGDLNIDVNDERGTIFSLPQSARQER